VYYGELWVNGQGQDTWCDSNFTITDPAMYKLGGSHLHCKLQSYIYVSRMDQTSHQIEPEKVLPDGSAMVGKNTVFVCAEQN